MRKISLTTSIIILTLNALAKAEFPQFDQYQLSRTDIYKAEPAPVVISSYPHAENYRTVLTKKAKDGPNFAGHYTIVTMGCGEQCQDNWLIDARTGKIHDRFKSQLGIKYQLDSSMLVINPPNSQEALDLASGHMNGNIQTKVQVWKDDRFDVIKTMNWDETSKNDSKLLKLK